MIAEPDSRVATSLSFEISGMAANISAVVGTFLAWKFSSISALSALAAFHSPYVFFQASYLSVCLACTPSNILYVSADTCTVQTVVSTCESASCTDSSAAMS